MTQISSKSSRAFAHTALQDARTSLSAATQALKNMANPQPWSRERLNHAHAQDLLKHAQRQVAHLYSK